MRTMNGVGLLVCAALVASVGGCTADIHDNVLNVDDPKVSFDTDVDVDNIEQGQSVQMTINAENIYPVAPDAVTPEGHEEDAVYFVFYLDDEDNAELLVTAEVNVNLTIPLDTEPGDHTVICRAHKHKTKEATSVTFEMDIKVKVKAS